MKKRLTITFSPSDCIVQDCSMRKEVGTNHKIDRLFVLNKLYILHIFGIHSVAIVSPTVSSFMSWHNRLGHPSFSKLSQLINKGLLGSVFVIKELCCVNCKLFKQSTLHFSSS